VTATSVQISWTPAAGALSYVISRDGSPDVSIGANAGFLQGGHYLYTDIGRRPAMLYTYVITAQFAAPVRAHRSAPVQIMMPIAAPPPNFRAVVSGPGAVTLTWSARPEALGYRIVRNGGNLPPTSFDATAGLAFTDQNAPVGDYTYIVASLIRLASGELTNGEYSNPVRVLTRPFNIVAVGDSVMWGQGLLEPHKFSTGVQSWIQSEVGGAVPTPNVKAHSGAVTFPVSLPLLENQIRGGEVPSDWPTITHQIVLASSPGVANAAPADVDLVLIDGCANNVDLTNIMNPVGDDGALRSETLADCGDGMVNLLRQAVPTFPNAQIIVTGYYQIVSNKSDLAALLPVFAGMASIGTAVVHPIVHAVPVLPPDPLGVGIPIMLGFRARATARSDEFYQLSNSSLQAAVDQVNTEALPGRTRFNQIRFAALVSTPDTAYAAPQTREWLIPTPPLAQDEMYGQRIAQCTAVYGAPVSSKLDYTKCLEASMGHPNVAGAQAYVAAIKQVGAEFVPQWRTQHQSSSAATEDPVVVRVQLGPMDPSGGTLAITATNGPAGPPMAGTVQFNAAPVGPLGASLHYSNQPNGTVVSVVVPGHPPHSLIIPPRTIS
jgi:hypothetical protein